MLLQLGAQTVELTASAVVVASCLLGAGGLVAGKHLTMWAARRASEQPLALEVDGEKEVITHVWAQPHRWPVVCELDSQDFCVEAHQQIWEALESAWGKQKILEQIKKAKLDRKKNPVNDTVLKKLADYGNSDSDDEKRQAVLALLAGNQAAVNLLVEQKDETAVSENQEDDNVDDGKAEISTTKPPAGVERLLEVGSLVLAASDDRGRLGGSGLVEKTGDSQRPLRRKLRPVTHTRIVLSTLAIAGGFALGPVLLWSHYKTTPVAWGLACLSVVCLVILSYVVGIVDLETFYLDVKTFWGFGLASWAFAVAATWKADQLRDLLAGVVIVLIIGVFLEVSNRLYKLVRGIDGMGFGDTMIIMATSGVPAALTGNIVLGFWALMFGMIMSILAHLVAMKRTGAGSQTPFAFGPYLALGWPVAWAAVNLLSFMALV